MKNINLTLNVILLVCIAFLFYKVYSKNEQPVIIHPTSSNGIVYINSDSLLDNFDYYNEIHDRLEKKKDSLDAYLESKSRRLESEVAAYQQQAPAMSQSERQNTEDGLMRKQQSIIEERKRLVEVFSNEEEALNDSLYNRLQSAIESYNKNHNYTFILGYQRGGGILFANDSLNITNDVIKVLNDQ